MRALSAAGQEREIAAAEAPVGTRFIVRPGERIALDGRVVVGMSAIDQGPITGESVPVAKEPGGEVSDGPASIAVAALISCALFGTASGTVGAVVTLMGVLAYPAMLKARYDIRLCRMVHQQALRFPDAEKRLR